MSGGGAGIAAEGGWSAEDRRRIAEEGLTIAEADRQLALFRQGITPVRLNRPCRAGDGIDLIPEEEKISLIEAYEGALRTRRFIKFVPASGAASRMFGDWYRSLDDRVATAKANEGEAFLSDLRRYAFFSDLEAAVAAKGQDLAGLMANRAGVAILSFIMKEEGLNYGRLPKALLKFHAYPEGNRTALEEHLVEAVLYARDGQNVSHLHFTVSREHETAVRHRLKELTGDYESRLNTVFEIGLSTQDPATNTLTADLMSRPFRDERGGLVFRPGGHGALLSNLNAIGADIVFLKNIDNCVPDRLKPETVLWKKILAGCLIALQDGIFGRLHLLDAGETGEAKLKEIEAFCREKLHLDLPADFGKRSLSGRRSILFEKLNRPLRICGMVKNEGEPGGGPFWVDDPDGTGSLSLQIVEESQIDRSDSGQWAIWLSSTHFNPVDLVCGVRDFQGRTFDLTRFADPRRSTISHKYEKGRELLALERPGLWNGSMAFWNSIFVEVPLATFNPVKTVRDLLRPQHLSA